MNSLLADPCCLGAIAALVLYGFITVIARVVANYQRGTRHWPSKEATEQ